MVYFLWTETHSGNSKWRILSLYSLCLNVHASWICKLRGVDSCYPNWLEHAACSRWVYLRFCIPHIVIEDIMAVTLYQCIRTKIPSSVRTYRQNILLLYKFRPSSRGEATMLNEVLFVSLYYSTSFPREFFKELMYLVLVMVFWNQTVKIMWHACLFTTVAKHRT
jgi:hypothetical protein